ncbi:MAG: hypothetical protein IKS85_07230 [Lachnospiraceae bacterium]|nr:hypothetical protein [Lachnospiraceae bacterium]
MKKFIKTIALTLAAVLVFGLTVSAAGSVSTQTASAVDQQLAVDAQHIANNGVSGGSFTVGNLSEKWIVRAQRYADAHGLGKVLTIFDLSSSATNVNVTLRYDGLKDNQSYCFLHYIGANWQDDSKYDENAWEVIAATKNDKYLTGFFTKFSPVGIVEGSASAATVVAPRTGEVIALAAIMALVMIAGAVVCAKKARLQK